MLERRGDGRTYATTICMSLLPKTTLTTHHLTTHPHLSLYPFSTILHLLPSPQTHTSSFTFPPPIPSPYLQHFNLSTFLLPFLPFFISYLPPLLTFFFTFLQLFLYLFYKNPSLCILLPPPLPFLTIYMPHTTLLHLPVFFIQTMQL